MRRILIDFARAQETHKRGHRPSHVNLLVAEDVPGSPSDPLDLIDLDQALEDLARLDARQAKLVELRYFGGLENAEIAAVLGISEPTVVRDWRVARAWLFNRLRSAKNDSPAADRVGP
jgi:RNA polymerase sigma-70 factor, ECF subfamily